MTINTDKLPIRILLFLSCTAFWIFSTRLTHLSFIMGGLAVLFSFYALFKIFESKLTKARPVYAIISAAFGFYGSFMVFRNLTKNWELGILPSTLFCLAALPFLFFATFTLISIVLDRVSSSQSGSKEAKKTNLKNGLSLAVRCIVFPVAMWAIYLSSCSCSFASTMAAFVSLIVILQNDAFYKSDRASMLPLSPNLLANDVDTASEAPHLRITRRVIVVLTYLFISLPFLIFAVGWFKLPFALAAVAIVVVSLFFAIRGKYSFAVPDLKDKKDILLILAIMVISYIWIVSSGIGGFVFQNDDHKFRNEVFRLLIEKPWPVTKVIDIGQGTNTYVLNYYFGFWLPPALVGKAFGLGAGYIAQQIWAWLGINLVFCHLLSLLKRRSLIPVILFICFSGIDTIGQICNGIDIFSLPFSTHGEVYSDFQYSAFSTQLFWVYNQAIYGWLIFLFILQQKKNRHIILILSTSLLNCTFPFVGMLPYLVYIIFRNADRTTDGKIDFKSSFSGLFTFENIAGGGLIGLVSFLSLRGNSAAQNKVLDLTPTLEYWVDYLIFIAFDVLVFLAILYYFKHKDPLYWISFGWLLFCPLFKIGHSADFCMRASIPALMILFMMLTQYGYKLKESLQKKNDIRLKIRAAIVALVLIIGVITPIHELARTIESTTSGSNLIYITEEELYGYEDGNFICNMNDNGFIKLVYDLDDDAVS